MIEEHASCCKVEYVEQKIVILERTLKKTQYIKTLSIYSHNVYIWHRLTLKATQKGCCILLQKEHIL